MNNQSGFWLNILLSVLSSALSSRNTSSTGKEESPVLDQPVIDCSREMARAINKIRPHYQQSTAIWPDWTPIGYDHTRYQHIKKKLNRLAFDNDYKACMRHDTKRDLRFQYIGTCFDVNEGLPIYENSSVISAAEFWLSRSFSYTYPGEYVGLFGGCQQFEEKDFVELQRFFSIVSRIRGRNVTCACSPAIELSFPNFQRAKIVCSFNLRFTISSWAHSWTRNILFSISELRILQESHPNFKMSFCPTVEGFNERILKVINGIRGHNRIIDSSSSNEHLVQIAKNYLFRINYRGTVKHTQKDPPAAVFRLELPEFRLVGDFNIDEVVDAAVRSWKKDHWSYRYPGENHTLEVCGLYNVSLGELRSNRFLMMVSEATTDIKCEALDYTHSKISRLFMIACAFQQDQFQLHDITGDVIFSQSELENYQNLGLEIGFCTDVDKTEVKHNIQNSLSRGNSTDKTIKYMMLFLFHFFFCNF